MFFPSFGFKKALVPQNGYHHISVEEPVVDRNSDLVSEEKFREILQKEIKRTKRSGNPFLLMIVQIEELLKNSGGRKKIKKIVKELYRNSRDTDAKGWYKHESSIGVALTEINGFPPEMVARRFHEKMDELLGTFLNQDELSSLSLSFKIFPEKIDKRTLKCSSAVKLDLSVNGTIAADEDLAHSQNCENSESSDQPETRFSEWKRITTGPIKQQLLLLLGDICIISTVYFLSAWLRFGIPTNIISVYTGACLISLIVYMCAFYIFDLYNLSREFKNRETIARAAFAVILSGTVTACFFFWFPHWQFGRGIFFVQIILIATLVAAWRTIFGKLLQNTNHKKSALILGTGRSGMAISQLLNGPLSPYQIKGFLDHNPSSRGKLIDSSFVLGTIDQLDKVAEKVWIKSAILATPRNSSSEMIKKILDARFRGLEVVEMATVYERLTGRIPVRFIEDQWLLFADGFYLISKEYIQKLKRLIDIFVSGSILICSLPFMALTAFLIRIDSPGPVFYRQERVGKNGWVFRVLKFRSMVQNAESSVAKWCDEEDKRITRVGRWIRKFRIDELPQLWNVFKGEMSLIGPRPERPEFVKELEKVIPYYGTRHAVVPGITGWAQVNYPYGASVDDALQKLEYDLYYIKNMSLLLDFKIALKTIGVILLGDGAR